MRLSLPQKWLPAMSQMYSEMTISKKMLNVLHLKIFEDLMPQKSL